jgi:pyrroline-5-carboxylate reductase
MNIGIIGFGNLGRALATGLVKSDVVHMGDLRVCEKDPDARAIAEDSPYFAGTSEDVGFAIKDSDVVFLTVKAYVFEELAAGIEKGALDGKTVVSFMAGVTLERLYTLLDVEPPPEPPESDENDEPGMRVEDGQQVATRVVRAMPSLAIASCEGVIGYTAAPADVEEIFGNLGYAFVTAPGDIDKVMAFSSCGLGFAAYLIDAFAEAGRSMGFSEENCTAIASRTFKNAINMRNYRETVKAVATPGGATEQGILHMDGSGVYDIVAEAVRKAYERFQ